MSDLIPPKIRQKFFEVLKRLNVEPSIVCTENFTANTGNFTSFIIKVRVEDADEKDRRCFIVKCATYDGFARIIPIRKIFLREIDSYGRVFREFETLQDEKIVERATFYPKFYGFLDEEKNEAVILDDLVSLGYRDRHLAEVLNCDHVKAVLKEFAQSHALCFALRDQKKEVFNSLAKNFDDIVFRHFSKELYKLYFDACKYALDLLVDEDQKNLYGTVAKTFMDHSKIMDEIFNEKLMDDYGVFVHCDGRLGNMLFKYNDDETVQKACIIDWQAMALASPVVDLVYAILVNTNKELRDQHYVDFIQYYYEVFSSFLRTLGSDPDRLFPFKVLERHLTEYGVYSTLYSVLCLYNILIKDADKVTGDHDQRIKDVITDSYNLGFLYRNQKMD